MPKPPIYIDDCTKIELHIHVLGYYPKGESIFIVLWNAYDKSVLRALLVDCYTQKAINKFDDLFKNYQLSQRKLDYFVWTHPDMDHSLGIPDVMNTYAGAKTKVLVPEGLKRTLFRSFSSTLYKAFLSIQNHALKERGSVIPVSTCGLYDKTPSIVDRYQDGIGDGFVFSLEILAPFAEHSFRWTEVLKSFKKNDISIAFNIQFGHHRFFFGGDAMNDAISRIEADRLGNTIFVKIPHHGSSTSDNLSNLYKNVLNRRTRGPKHTITAVTTTFEEHPTHLPESAVLDGYKDIAKKILNTSDYINSNKYGICTFVYGCNSKIPKEKRCGDVSDYYEYVPHKKMR